MAGTVETLRDVAASRRAQRQYRGDLRRHLAAAQEHLTHREWAQAGHHLIAAGTLGELSLLERLREPKP